MPHVCKSIGCCNPVDIGDFCAPCLNSPIEQLDSPLYPLSEKYPDQYRDLGDLTEIDVHAVLHLFEIPDHSGCLQQACMQLLMTGTSLDLHKNVRAARDALTRWLQLNPEPRTK